MPPGCWEAHWDAGDLVGWYVTWAEKVCALPAAGLVWPGGMVCQELSCHMHSISWIPWHLSPGNGELGCTDLAKHEIKVTDEKSVKERLWRIPPPMVDQVCSHMKEMLETDTICASQSLWCNVVVLVCKKDGGLYFCIDFCNLNVRTKKDSYPLPWIKEVIESLVGTGYFSCLDLKAGFWQIAMDEASKQYTAFTVGNIEFFECEHMPLELCNAPATLQRLSAELFGWVKPDLLFDLLGWCDYLFKDRRGTFTAPAHCVWALQGAQSEAHTNQVWILQEWDQLFGSSCLQGSCAIQQGEHENWGYICSTMNLHWNLNLFRLGGTLLMVY